MSMHIHDGVVVAPGEFFKWKLEGGGENMRV